MNVIKAKVIDERTLKLYEPLDVQNGEEVQVIVQRKEKLFRTEVNAERRLIDQIIEEEMDILSE